MFPVGDRERDVQRRFAASDSSSCPSLRLPDPQDPAKHVVLPYSVGPSHIRPRRKGPQWSAPDTGQLTISPIRSLSNWRWSSTTSAAGTRSTTATGSAVRAGITSFTTGGGTTLNRSLWL